MLSPPGFLARRRRFFLLRRRVGEVRRLVLDARLNDVLIRILPARPELANRRGRLQLVRPYGRALAKLRLRLYLVVRDVHRNVPALYEDTALVEPQPILAVGVVPHNRVHVPLFFHVLSF